MHIFISFAYFKNIKIIIDQTLVSVDFCQIELRILAHLSKDSILLSALTSPGDVFINLSSKWHKIPETEVCVNM